MYWKKGFTIVELLIVVSLIGILAGVVLVVIKPSEIQARGRDARRKSDLDAVRVALELYLVSQPDRKYPIGPYSALSGPGANDLDDYLDGPLPTDPKDGSAYTYTTNAERTGFCLNDDLEIQGAGRYEVKGGLGC